jgi:hypothetical protein
LWVDANVTDTSLRLGWFPRSNTREIINIGEKTFEKSTKSRAMDQFQARLSPIEPNRSGLSAAEVIGRKRPESKVSERARPRRPLRWGTAMGSAHPGASTDGRGPAAPHMAVPLAKASRNGA